MHTRWRFVGLIVLLGIFFAQAAAASPHNAVTFDEQYHMTPGYVYLKTGDLRFHHDQNPPLFEAITALPLLLRSDITLPINDPAYKLWSDVYLFADDFIWHANSDGPAIINTGRLSIAAFGVVFGLLLFVWGKQLFGEPAGWIAACLFVFDPNFIANAIPTLDLGLAFTVALAIWRLAGYLKHPTKLNLILSGLALGFALATKFLSVMLLPSFVLILLIYPQPQTESPDTRRRSFFARYSVLLTRLLHFGVMLLLAYLVLWFTYGFQFGPVSGAGLPLPAPQYFESFIGMFLKSSEGRANFLVGQTSITGWWYYFIIAFFIKTPLPTLLVIFFGFIRWPWKKEWRESSILIFPALFFFAGASISKLQLGYRYILPVLPFLFLIAARGLSVFLRSAATKNLVLLRRSVTAGLAAWLIIGTLSIFPHYLSYFNESIGGPANGYKYLIDSNLDWGQDLPALKEWIDQHQPGNLQLGFFGIAYPDRYGVSVKALPSVPLNESGHEVDAFTSYSLEPGQYALSATLLRVGLVFKQFNLYQNFESMTPIDQVANSILIYDVKYPIAAPIDRAVIVGPLASDVLPADLGYQPNQPLRAKWCDPAQCFIFTPHPARYIVQNFIPFDSNLASQASRSAQLVASPISAYRVFDLDAAPIIQNQLTALHKFDVSAPAGFTLTLPISFDTGLSFAGYEINQLPAGIKLSTGLDINTYWLVTGSIAPPLTVFVHLLDANNNIVGQDDNFGAAARMLEPGDLIVQYHSIKINDGTPPGTYRLEIGLYNPNTGTRFMAQAANETVDHLLLSTIELKP